MPLEEYNGAWSFDCDHVDLNDFFLNDARHYSEELLGKSYIFCLTEDLSRILVAFTVSNDSLILNHTSSKNRINRKIPNSKRMHSYPAVLIGRLGVDRNHTKQGIGSLSHELHQSVVSTK